MKIRLHVLILACAVVAATTPLPAWAWAFNGARYAEGNTRLQLGDLCDAGRFPLTPGNCSGDAGNPDWRVELQTAIQRWHDATSLFEFRTDPGPGQSEPGQCSASDPSSIHFSDTFCGSAFGSTTLAVAQTFFYSGGEAVHSDVVFNTAWTWDAYDGPVQENAQDFRRVAVHELGHVMGLKHPVHDNAIMAPTVDDSIAPLADDIQGVGALYGILKTLVVPDLNSNGETEIASVRSLPNGIIRAEVRDAASGSQLRLMNFLNAGFAARDAVVLPDQDGDGVPELALLAIEKSTGRGVIEIRNLLEPQARRRILLSPGYTRLRLAMVPDADADGADELAILSIAQSDGRTWVEMRNAIGIPATRRVNYGQWASTLDFAVLEDGDGDGAREIAVLGLRPSDSRGQVQTRNVIGAPASRTVLVSAALDVRQLLALDDADQNGIPDVGVLTIRHSDGRIVSELFNVRESENRGSVVFSNHLNLETAARLGDTDGNGVVDMGVLVQRFDGRLRLEMANASGPPELRRLLYSDAYESGRSLTAGADVDGNGIADGAVLMSRRSDGRLLIQQRNLVTEGSLTRQFLLRAE
jgi:hypothetical protein